MARAAKPSDFTVNVPDVGSFTFGQRTMRDEVAIQVEFARMIDGVEPTAWLEMVCGWISTLKVLTVRAPDGWDLDELDPLDDESYAKMHAVHQALGEQERSFRRGPGVAGQADGA